MKWPALVGKHVLVVEDELMVALTVEDALEDAGCVVVGPFSRVAVALPVARVEAIDLAVLDVNLAGEMVFPVAYALEDRGIPFLFLTGYGKAALPPERPNWKACVKPFQPEHLTQMLTQLIKPP